MVGGRVWWGQHGNQAVGDEGPVSQSWNLFWKETALLALQGEV